MPRNSYFNTTCLFYQNEKINFDSNNTVIAQNTTSGTEEGDLVKFRQDGNGTVTTVNVENPKWVWNSKVISAGAVENVRCACIGTDTYVLGEYNDTLEFYDEDQTKSGSANSSMELLNSGDTEMFVGKINTSGYWQWTARIAKVGDNISSLDIRTFDSGVYISIAETDNFSSADTLFYNAGSLTANSAMTLTNSVRGIAIAKIDVDGVWSWTTKITQSSGPVMNKIEYVNSALYCSITCDDSANFHNFGSVAPTFTTTHTGHKLAKLDTSGSWKWIAGIETSENTNDFINVSGDTYIAGAFDTSANFYDHGNSINATHKLVSFGKNGVVAMVNDSGVWQWSTKIVPGSSFGEIYRLVEVDRNLYVYGRTSTSAIFFTPDNINLSELTLTSSSIMNFVASLSVEGNWRWSAKIIEGSGVATEADSMLTDGKDVYIVIDSLSGGDYIDIYDAYDEDPRLNDRVKFVGAQASVLSINDCGKWNWSATVTDVSISSLLNKRGAIIRGDDLIFPFLLATLSNPDIQFFGKGETNSGTADITISDPVPGSTGYSAIAKLTKQGQWKWVLMSKIGFTGADSLDICSYGTDDLILLTNFSNADEATLKYYEVNSATSDLSDFEVTTENATRDIIISKVMDNDYTLFGKLVNDSNFLYEGIITHDNLPEIVPLQKYYYSEVSPFITTKENNNQIGIGMSSTELLLKQLTQ